MSSALAIAKTRVTDALHALDLLESRLAGVTEQQLAGNDILIDACAYRIGVVGEAISYAKDLAPTVFKRCSPVGFTWDQVIVARNQFYHEYNLVSAKAILMFSSYIPALKLALANAAGSL